MSANSTLTALEQEIVALTPAGLVANYTSLSAAVLLLYDYFVTFPLERRHIWQGKVNIMKILFILNRYCSLIAQCALVLTYFVTPLTNIECQAFYYLSQVATTIFIFAITSIFIFRTYAIYGRSSTVFFALAVPGYVGLASGIWLIVVQTTFALPRELQIGPNTCWFNSSSSFAVAELVNIVSNAVFDVFIVILTACRTGQLAMQSRKVKIKNSLSFVLLRDGILYYSVIFVPQFVIIVLDVIVFRTGSATLDDISDALSSVNDGLQIVMVNRLVLNLIRTANTNEDSEFRTRTGLEPPIFATGPFLGSIGGPLAFHAPPSFDDDLLEDDGRVDGDIKDGGILPVLDASNADEMGESAGDVNTGISEKFEEFDV